MTDILADLNPAQREAVTTVHGPVLVLAGPGSGKTRVLTHRVAYLIRECGVEPYRLMAVTFTNKAAREMSSRIERLLGSELRGLTIGTFHATCARILRREAAHANLSPGYVIYDEDDQLRVVRQALKDLNLDEKRYRPVVVRSFIDRAKCELLTPQTLEPRTHPEEVARRVYERYEALLEANDALDFGDLLLRTALLFEQEAEVLEKYRRRYHFLLVDEFQDTNMAQYRLIRLLAGERRNLFVVADEDQAIYRFRGADYRNIQRFREDFPDHKLFLLERNYRSTQTILDAANAVIAASPYRTPKRLHTDKGRGPLLTVFEAYNEEEEASYVVNEIQRLVSQGLATPGECAVMYRTNAQSRALEDAFIRHGMPYKLVGATRFYARREIRDALAYLRLIHNPHDSVSLERVINVPRRGIGERSLATLAQWAGELGVSQYEALQLLKENKGKEGTEGTEGGLSPPMLFGTRAQKQLLAFLDLLEGWRELAGRLTVAELLGRVLEDTEYESWLRDGSEEGEERWANLMELRTVAADYDPLPRETALATFLEEVALVADVDNLPETAEAPTLLTLHSAKGLEFGVVFIVGLEEGILPHSRSFDDPEQMEEERRLCYVGITRAKERLYLLHAFRRSRYGGDDLNVPSRFLKDVPSRLVQGYGTRRHGDRERGRLGEGERQRQEKSPSLSPSTPASLSQVGPQFAVGQRVRHPLFGEGTVIESSLKGDDEEVKVAFPGKGIKTLLASFARLQRLDRSDDS
ncbi:MAG: UvrD-helicase domain-containing protein [Anaerolineae bacterium]|nr:UvrD-helicase domain-containing protein [Anaerolineae bacterium]